MAESRETRKIPVPAFLKILSNNNVPVAKAMAVTGKIYKDFNTPAMLAQLTDVKLNAAGVNDKEDRKLVLAAVRKAGYTPKAFSSTGDASPRKEGARGIDDSPIPGPSTPSMSTVQTVTTPVSKKKRKREEELNELLPSGPRDEAAAYGSLEFNEVLDEEVLKSKSTVVNRAPLMTAWATVVAERMGFLREEALSIASVYTELNAISKGVSLGIFEQGKGKGMEATRSGSQPYVDLMGRRVPLYQTQTSQWRALSSNTPAQPSTAFSYISRSLRQTTPYIIGALRLLAASYGPGELNEKGFALYADFRPTVAEWGKRGELRCDRILEMRKKDPEKIDGSTELEGSSKDVVKVENVNGPVEEDAQPDRKKSRGLSLEEYEAALDEDPTFDDIDLSELP